MNNEGVTLILNKKMKWFIYVSETIALGCFLFLLINLWSVIGFSSAESIFLLIIFICGFIGCILTLIYSSRHKVHFGEEGIEKFGIFNKKFISYKNLEEIWFAPRFWDMKSSVALFSSSKVLVFDYRYKNPKEVADFLMANSKLPEHTNIYFDQEELQAS